MKGVKYNLSFKLPNGDSLEKININMKDLCNLITQNFKTYYYLDEINVSNQVIYNLIKRPHSCSKIVRSKCNVVVV